MTTRPMRQATKEQSNGDARFRNGVRKRDGAMCRFLRKVKTMLGGAAWATCGRYGSDACHIYRRSVCGAAKFDPAVGIWGCRDCHDRYDRHESDVKVSIVAKRRAYDAIAKAAKTPPPGGRPAA